MKKKPSPLANRLILRNYVAKHNYNKSAIHTDKTKYNRKRKNDND